MKNSEKLKTATELNLQDGFPPLIDKMVNHDNQLFAPYNRWSFQNELKLNRTSDVWRGNEQISQLLYNPLDIIQIIYQNKSGKQVTFEDMVELSYTDGIIVLYKGKIIYEKYLNGMHQHTLHAWASSSKSMTGTLAAILADEGIFNLDDAVQKYLPELKESGFADATIRQVMDITTAFWFFDDEIDYVNENTKYGIALGWRKDLKIIKAHRQYMNFYLR